VLAVFVIVWLICGHPAITATSGWAIGLYVIAGIELLALSQRS